MGLLADILDAKRGELEVLRRLPLPSAPALRPLALRRQANAPLKFLAEIKRRSPSAGQLSTALSVGERATIYEKAGASMISVLCDTTFFDGHFEHLAQARTHCSLPLLCKEFVIDEVQLRVARAFGADAVLLIVRCLSAQQLVDLVQASSALGLTPLVEVTSEAEAKLAVASGAPLIGVNARDLDTLVMNAERAQRILQQLPADRVRIYLSGVATPAAVSTLAQGPADAVLIGETLMREDNPWLRLTELVAAGAGSAQT